MAGHFARVLVTGLVKPAHEATPLAVQKRKNGKWVTVKGGVTRVEVNPRCTDPKSLPTFTQFGQFAAEYFVFMASGQKGHRPASVRC